jgi:hypothetical protein
MTSQPTREGYRAIVAGDADGSSRLLSDERQTSVQLPTGRSLAQLWRCDQLISVIDGDDFGTPFPGTNGARLWVLEIPPDGESADYQLHATATTDVGFLLEGEVDLELDDGSVTRLRHGDAFVQTRGAHRWVNRSASTAVIGVVVIGTDSAKSTSGGAH